MSDISSYVKQRLDHHDWNDTIPRLLKYATSRIRQMSWYQEQGGDVAIGRMAEDFVMEAIMKTYHGERKWNPDKYPDLLGFLFGVLKSDIGHQANSLENRSVRFFESLSQERAKKAHRNMSTDGSALTDEFLSGFMTSLGDDDHLVAFTQLVAAGQKPRDIAQELRVPIKDVYNCKKVLKRKLAAYLNQMERGLRDG